jgi:solute carrier family 45 protein 1/2/4
LGHGPATSTSVLIAVFGFYVLDFAINCIQGCSRALLVDIASRQEQDVINAYASFMISLGSIAGYATGFIDLSSAFHVHAQSSQFMVLCAISCSVLITTTCITCLSVKERSFQISGDQFGGVASSLDPCNCGFIEVYWKPMIQPFKDVLSELRKLPPSIQRVCNVQFFAWLGWFPFLFYSSTYVAQYAANNQKYVDAGAFVLSTVFPGIFWN